MCLELVKLRKKFKKPVSRRYITSESDRRSLSELQNDENDEAPAAIRCPVVGFHAVACMLEIDCQFLYRHQLKAGEEGQMHRSPDGIA